MLGAALTLQRDNFAHAEARIRRRNLGVKSGSCEQFFVFAFAALAAAMITTTDARS